MKGLKATNQINNTLPTGGIKEMGRRAETKFYGLKARTFLLRDNFLYSIFLVILPRKYYGGNIKKRLQDVEKMDSWTLIYGRRKVGLENPP
jgi:hypothetical protein|uniref:Uncharacterized protein n=1 Tax=Candidatus Aramenus sulfurataquae TaxID=1326980 RepID=A0A0F2LLR7_9CREN